MAEKNFIEKMLDAGFERDVSDLEKKKGRYDCSWNPKNGWMGTVIYHPWELFKKGDKTIELSLERFNVTDIKWENGKTEFTKVNEKHIIITVGDKEIYRNNFGVLPPQEIQNQLING